MNFRTCSHCNFVLDNKLVDCHMNLAVAQAENERLRLALKNIVNIPLRMKDHLSDVNCLRFIAEQALSEARKGEG